MLARLPNKGMQLTSGGLERFARCFINAPLAADPRVLGEPWTIDCEQHHPPHDGQAMAPSTALCSRNGESDA